MSRSLAHLRYRARLFAAVLACAAAGCGLLAPGAGAAEPGVVLGAPSTDATTLSQIQASGARHVRVFMSWRSLESQQGHIVPHLLRGFDDFVNLMRARGVGVYFVVVETPGWASGGGPRDAPPPTGPYADFLRRIALHFQGRVQGYEVWNEPEDPVSAFWRGGAAPATYAGMLRASYGAVKSVDAGAKVGVGALLGNNYEYLEKLYAAGAKGSFDFVGLHTDTDCNRSDPRHGIRAVDGRISRHTFTGYREVRQTMLDNNDPKAIWMSEIGWSVTTIRCPSRPAEPAGVTPAQQAQFLTAAYECMANDPYVEIASWFSLADFGAMETIGFRYGLFAHNGVPRPSLAAFQRAGVARADPACGLHVDRNGSGLTLQYPVEGQNVSGDLRFKAVASEGVATLAVLVDGRQVKVTARNTLTGVWPGWRRLPYGPHKVTVRAKDNAQNISTHTVNVNRVPYGLGEPIGTRIKVGLYGKGKSRIAGAQVFTKPAVARSFLRGRMKLHFERKAGRRWVKMGGARGSSAKRSVKATRKFKAGKYRVVVTFAGYKSFKPSVGRKFFTVR